MSHTVYLIDNEDTEHGLYVLVAHHLGTQGYPLPEFAQAYLRETNTSIVLVTVEDENAAFSLTMAFDCMTTERFETLSERQREKDAEEREALRRMGHRLATGLVSVGSAPGTPLISLNPYFNQSTPRPSFPGTSTMTAQELFDGLYPKTNTGRTP